MGLLLFRGSRPGMLPFRIANLAAFLEDLLHEIISGKDSTRAAPILGPSRRELIGKQGTDMSLQCFHSFFKRHPGHDETPCIEANGVVIIVAAPAARGKTSPECNTPAEGDFAICFGRLGSLVWPHPDPAVRRRLDS